MSHLVEWSKSEEGESVLHAAVDSLSAGRLVVFPTEAGYCLAASSLHTEAVEAIAQPAGGQANGAEPLTLALRSAGESGDWVPAMTQVGRRLVRRCWPGPVTLVFAGETVAGLRQRLPVRVQEALLSGGGLAIRVPAHEAVRQVLGRLPAPLVLRSCQPGSGHPWHELEIRQLGDAVGLVIDDGPPHYSLPPSVVEVTPEGWRMCREGVVPARALACLSSCVILFVCTGNTCRSPLAEGLCKKLLADRLGCTPEELPQRGFVVLSAGVSAMMGGRATAEAIATAQARGVDLKGHVSQPLTAQLLAQADHVFAMTHGHLHALTVRFPRTESVCEVLSPSGHDLDDPIGGSQEIYDACADQISRDLELRLAQLVPETAPR